MPLTYSKRYLNELETKYIKNQKIYWKLFFKFQEIEKIVINKLRVLYNIHTEKNYNDNTYNMILSYVYNMSLKEMVYYYKCKIIRC